MGHDGAGRRFQSDIDAAATSADADFSVQPRRAAGCRTSRPQTGHDRHVAAGRLMPLATLGRYRLQLCRTRSFLPVDGCRR